MKALIIDDHPIARGGLRALLASSFKTERIVESADGAQAIAAARALQPDLVLVDLDLPGHPRGAVLCAQLQATVSGARIVVVTAFDRGSEIRQCLAAGAHGCLLKDADRIDIGRALQKIVAGEIVVDPRLAAEMASEMVKVLRGEAPTVHLTPREREVLTLLAQGCSNRMISERLVIAETTVKDHVGGLLDKLSVDSRLQAVVRASELGLL